MQITWGQIEAYFLFVVLPLAVLFARDGWRWHRLGPNDPVPEELRMWSRGEWFIGLLVISGLVLVGMVFVAAKLLNWS